MSFNQQDQICYLTADSLSDAKIIHAFFTRHGGVSPVPWARLNVGGLVGDDVNRVIENRLRSFRAIGRDPGSIYDVWQVHGTDVVCTDSPRPANTPHIKADSILTDSPGVTLFMRFADCVPIMLYDPYRRVVGLVHAGWQGTVKQSVAAAIQAMMSVYCTKPADILAVIGPSICVNHYEVGEEVVQQVKSVFGEDSSALLNDGNASTPPGKANFDLWLANRLILERSGVANIEVTGQCTACHNKDWFSHRAEKGRTGRFGVLIALRD